ncbi:MAG: MFS transporter [Clostridia bacterium]|nr:MFS transporter [Clostridia bacterium]
MVKEKLSKRNWFLIALFCFVGGIAWNTENMYFNTFIYNTIYADASKAAREGAMAPSTAISRMVALSAVAAVLTTFVMGTLSDKLKNRRLFISVGYILWGIVTGLFGFITKENVAGLFHLNGEALILTLTVWFVIFMDIVMTFMGSTSNDAAFQAWVTDVTVPGQRALVETVLSVVGAISSLAVTGVGSFAQAGKLTYKAFFIGLGAIVSACGIAGLFLIKDPPRTLKKSENNSNYISDLVYGFRPSVIKSNPRLYLALCAFGISVVAFQVFFPYLLVYIQYVVIPDNGGVQNILRPSVIITAVLVAAALVTVIVTLLKLSSKNKGIFLIPCTILMTAGLFFLSTTTNIHVMLICVLPVVIGNAIISILLGAAVKDFIPEGKAGLFQGIRMIFVVLIPMVAGPVLGDIACRNAAATYTNELGVETIVPSKEMFFVAGVVCALALIPLFFLVRKGFDVEEPAGENAA